MDLRYHPRIVLAAGLAFLLTTGCGQDRQAGPVSEQRTAPVSYPQAAPVSGQKAATSWKEYYQYLSAWYRETLLANYDAYGTKSPEWDAEVKTYLAEYANSLEPSYDQESVQGLQKLGQELLDLGCSDPVIHGLQSSVLIRLNRLIEAKQLTQRSQSPLMKSRYPVIFSYRRLRRLEWLDRNLDVTNTNFGRDFINGKMADLGNAAADPHFGNGNQRFYIQNVVAEWDDDCANPECADDLMRKWERPKDLDPWIEHMVRGLYHRGLAWEGRGGGWASTVKPEGWRVFQKELKVAEEHFVAAHELHPEFPEAATAMIAVSMATGGEVGEREWFDRAVAAQFDYGPAYRRLLWALRPRWGGSHEQMYQFGVECLETERFGTCVPYFLLPALWGIGSEMDDWRLVYRRPGTYKRLKTYFEGVLAEPSRAKEADYFKTQYGILAWAVEEYDDARKLFDELGDKVHLAEFKEFAVDADRVIGEVHWRTGPLKDDYSAAEKSFSEGQSLEALPLYEALSEKASDDAKTNAILRDRLAVLRMKKDFLDGDWVDILPEASLAGWEKKGGEWTHEADGTLKGVAEPTGTQLILLSEWEIEDNFEIRGKVTAQSFVGVLFGYVKRLSPEHAMLTIDHARETISLSKKYGPPSIDRSEKIGQTNRFTIQVWNSEVTVYLNDDPIFVAENIAALGVSGNGRIGIGCYVYESPEYWIKYHSLEARRLKKKPERPEVKEI